MLLDPRLIQRDADRNRLSCIRQAFQVERYTLDGGIDLVGSAADIETIDSEFGVGSLGNDPGRTISARSSRPTREGKLGEISRRTAAYRNGDVLIHTGFRTAQH